MASKTLTFTLLLAAFAAVQGSSIKDMAVEYSQMLAEHLSEGVDEIERLKGSAMDQVSFGHQAHLEKLVASAQSKVEQHAADCKPEQKQQVHQEATSTVTNRFLHCINFTDQITDLEKMIYNVSLQVSSVESGVCLAVTNLTACSGEEIIEEIHCVTSGLLGYIHDFSQHSSAIQNITHRFNVELKAIANQFLSCFTNVDNSVETFVKEFVSKLC